MAKQQLPHVPDDLCPEFIEKTGEPSPKKPNLLKPWLIPAACLVLFFLCWILLLPRNDDGSSAAEEPSVSADSLSTDPAVTLGRPGGAGRSRGQQHHLCLLPPLLVQGRSPRMAGLFPVEPCSIT